MPRKQFVSPDSRVSDYRHSEKRKNIPTAAQAALGKIKELPRARHTFDPHLLP